MFGVGVKGCCALGKATVFRVKALPGSDKVIALRVQVGIGYDNVGVNVVTPFAWTPDYYLTLFKVGDPELKLKGEHAYGGEA